MLPRVTIDGRVAAEPQLRFAQSGSAVCSLRVVASDRRRGANDEWEDGDTLWIDVTCFGKLAENTVESIRKGDLVLVYGRLRTEEWNERESGQKRTKITLIADTVGASLQFRQLPHAGAVHQARAAQPAPPSGDPWASSTTDDEPPF